VVDLHTRVLADNELTWLVDRPFLPVVAPPRWERMREMIECRNAEHRIWGFKDPRVCPFLMLWKYLLPDAKVLLVYRHFADSTNSLGRRHSSDMLLKRGNQHVHRAFWREPDLALRMWLFHNKALLAFARAYPQDTLTLSQAMIMDGFPLVRAVNRRWGLGLDDVPAGEVLDPSATARRSGRQPVSDRALIRAVLETWDELEDLGRASEAMLTGTRKEVAVV
jgi:hypothetical protein